MPKLPVSGWRMSAIQKTFRVGALVARVGPETAIGGRLMTDGQGMGEADGYADAYRALGGVPGDSLQYAVIKLRARLQIMRSLIRDSEWQAVCRSRPECASWFGEDGIPK